MEIPLKEYDWTESELFDMETDRGETRNIADKHTDVLVGLNKVCIK